MLRQYLSRAYARSSRHRGGAAALRRGGAGLRGDLDRSAARCHNLAAPSPSPFWAPHRRPTTGLGTPRKEEESRMEPKPPRPGTVRASNPPHTWTRVEDPDSVAVVATH